MDAQARRISEMDSQRSFMDLRDSDGFIFKGFSATA